jgi:peptidoglycan DL-endopeptidase CwlO
MLPPALQVALARKYGQQYGVDPRLLLAIGGHETQWGTTGAGRPSQGGYALGYGVTDSGILSKYAGLQNQYRYGASTLAKWGVHSIQDVMAGKAARWATDPAWEKGVQSVYGSIGGKLPANVAGPPAVPPPMAPPKAPRSVVMTPPAPRFQTVSRQVYDPGQLARGIFSSLAQGQTPDTPSLVRGAYKTVTEQMPLPPVPNQAKPGKLPPLPGHAQPRGPNVPATHTSSAIVSLAARQLGQPYVWGGESRKEGGFDCSGLIDWAMRQQGYKGGRITTNTIKSMGQSVKGKPLQPGDLVLSNGGEHVSIYAGNGKCIVAPHTGARVRWQPLSDFAITDVRRV